MRASTLALLVFVHAAPGCGSEQRVASTATPSTGSPPQGEATASKAPSVPSTAPGSADESSLAEPHGTAPAESMPDGGEAMGHGAAEDAGGTVASDALGGDEPVAWSWKPGHLEETLKDFFPLGEYSLVTRHEARLASSIAGGFSNDAADDAFRRIGPGLARCYSSGLRQDSAMAGPLLIDLSTAPTGEIVEVTLDGHDSLRPIARCLVEAVADQRFPETAVPRGSAAFPVRFRSAPPP